MLKAHQEPKRDGPLRLGFPKLGTSKDELADLVHDYGGINAVARDFHIEAGLLNRYMTGQMEPPYYLLLAIFWHTSYGFQRAFADSHWTHQYNTFKRKEAEAKVEHLERVVKHATALLEHRSDAASLVRASLEEARSSRLSLPVDARSLEGVSGA